MRKIKVQETIRIRHHIIPPPPSFGNYYWKNELNWKLSPTIWNEFTRKPKFISWVIFGTIEFILNLIQISATYFENFDIIRQRSLFILKYRLKSKFNIKYGVFRKKVGSHIKKWPLKFKHWNTPFIEEDKVDKVIWRFL